MKPALSDILDRLETHGPARVVIDREGRAVTTDVALLEYGIVPDVVFIRQDGWSLGAPAHLRDVARSLWADDWQVEVQV